MPIVLSEKPNNQQISTSQNFGQVIHIHKTYDTIKGMTGSAIFCVDKQSAELLEDKFKVNKLTEYKHREDSIYIFGKNTGSIMAKHIVEFDDDFQVLTIDSPVNSVFWVEEAMAIILWDRWSKQHALELERKF